MSSQTKLGRACSAWLVMGLVACGDAGSQATETTGDAGPDSRVGTPTDPSGELGTRYFAERSDEADYLFDDAELRSYELILAPEDLAFLDADPAEEIYVEGALKFEGETIGPVGIRYKGSVGAYFGCVAGGDFANPDGPKTCDRLSMKVKINWADDAQLFYGLKKLQFHAMKNDASMMRERLGYQVFRAMGVPAPRAVHAKLSINGEYLGVFALIEQIDGRFTRSRFADGKGNLYKEVWPLTAQGTAQGAAAFQMGQTTNENGVDGGVPEPVDRAVRFGKAMAGAAEGERLEVLDAWSDLGLWMRYLAVDRGLLNDDGIYHWYCGMGGCAPHNFYLYEEAKADRLYPIPWDMDIAMVLMNPITTIYTAWDETTHGCAPYTGPGPIPIPIRDAACDPILGGLTALQDEFDEHTRALLDGPFSQASVEADLDRWSAQIRDAVEDGASQNPGLPTRQGMQLGVDRLKQDLAEMRRRMQARLDRD